MKIGLLLSIVMLISTSFVLAQKELNIWPFGLKSEGNAHPLNRNYVLDFTVLPPTQYTIPDFETILFFYAVYSDPTEGQLLFFSNGLRIINGQGNILPNCDSINYGAAWEKHIDRAHPTEASGYFIAAGADSIWFIHQKLELPWNAESPGINNAMVTLLVHNGTEYECVLKNQDFHTGEMLALDMVRHGNGEDWWIIIPEYGTNRYSKYILSIHGIQWHDDQHIGTSISPTMYEPVGQEMFSKSGQKYVRSNSIIGNQVFDFDRCTGLLSNPAHIPLDEPYYPGARNAFSPNERFLYVPNFYSIIQYDLWSDNIPASGDTVAVWDQHVCVPDWPFGNGFYSITLGPDDKIYLSAYSSNNCLSVINRPDLRGIACDVRQHGIITPGTLNYSLPGYINYQLGPLKGSPCDPGGGE